MFQQLNTFLKRIHKKSKKNICKVLFSKKCKKIDEYKKLQKGKKNNKYLKIKQKNSRNKYNIQLNLKFKKQNYINLLIFIIITILVFVLIITKGTYFKIQNINIISSDGLSNTYILEKKLYYLKNQLIFKVNKEEIIKIIKKTEQNIENIEIIKNYPNTIKIKLFSSPVIFKTNLKGKNYLITQNGVLIPLKGTKSDKINIDIKHFEVEKYPDYKKLLSSETLSLISKLKNNLVQNITNLKIENIFLYKTEKELHFIINNKTRLIFDLQGNIQKQLKQLLVFNKEKTNITKTPLIYIDNRIIGKIYFCPKEEINKCIRNLNFIYNEKIKKSTFLDNSIKK